MSLQQVLSINETQANDTWPFWEDSGLCFSHFDSVIAGRRYMFSTPQASHSLWLAKSKQPRVVFPNLNCWNDKLAVDWLCRIGPQTVKTHVLHKSQLTLNPNTNDKALTFLSLKYTINPTQQQFLILNFQFKRARSPLDDSRDNRCQTRVIECEYRHCGEGCQALTTIFALHLKKGRLPSGSRVMRVLNDCEKLQRQCGHKLGWDLNHTSSLHMPVTFSNL